MFRDYIQKNTCYQYVNLLCTIIKSEIIKYVTSSHKIQQCVPYGHNTVDAVLIRTVCTYNNNFKF
jgi:hypothetical protein